MRTAIFLAGVVIADAMDRNGNEGAPKCPASFVATFLAVFVVSDLVEFFGRL